jgi:hypothetical protein
MTLSLHVPNNTMRYCPLGWFGPTEESGNVEALGFRLAPGGVHLTKTMMLAELTAVLNAVPDNNPAAVERSVIDDNLLGKPTGKARRLALSHLNALYGVLKPQPIQLAALCLWQRDVSGRPLLALLCALAREPLLRRSAAPVLDTPIGASVRWPDLASAILAEYPDRYSPKMLRSLAQNCASSWTQSGHLEGRVNKRRRLSKPTADAAAYAALLGSIASFGGPALLRSPWMRILDRSEADLLILLRQAESAGLARVRAGGGVIQVNVRGPMAELLGIPDLADR